MALTALCLCMALGTPAPEVVEPVEPVVIYRSGLRSGWQDLGWARRDILPGQPARVDFFDYGGWSIGGRETKGLYQALRLRLRAPAHYGAFLGVRLGGEGVVFPSVTITSAFTWVEMGEWREVRIPYGQLNPDGLAFDTVTLIATRPVPTGWVYIDDIALESGEAKVRTASTASAAELEELDEPLSLDRMAGLIVERPNIIGLAVHLGAGIPATGGSVAYTAGLSTRLAFAEDHVALGLQGMVSYHALAAKAGDPTGTVIVVRSEAVTLPLLGVLTLRLPLGSLAVYAQTGIGGAWVWASGESLGTAHSTSATTWAVNGAVGAEVQAGPGWLGLEAGYLILPAIKLPGVLHNYHGGGWTMLLHYRLGV